MTDYTAKYAEKYVIVDFPEFLNWAVSVKYEQGLTYININRINEWIKNNGV